MVLPLTDINGAKRQPSKLQRMEHGFLRLRIDQIQHDIKSLGADAYDLLLPETHALPYVIHPDERILGIVYGRYKQDNENQVGRGVLVATNRRIVLIDKKPLFIRYDDLAYSIISGIDYSWPVIAGTISLHTRLGDVEVRTFNQKCAKSFVEAVETVIFERNREAGNDQTSSQRTL